MTSNLSTQTANTPENRVNELGLIWDQRELALACFILSATLSIAVLWSNSGGEPNAIGETREAVASHRALLHQHQIILTDNQKVLTEVETARDVLRRTRVGR